MSRSIDAGGAEPGSAPSRGGPSKAASETEADKIPLPLPARALQTPERLALRIGGAAITYGELGARADVLARRLSTLGLRQGDRIAVLLPNGADLVAAMHACGRLGAILVPLNTRLTAEEIAFQLANTRPRVLLADECFRETIVALVEGGALVDGSGLAGLRLVWAGEAKEVPAAEIAAAAPGSGSPPAFATPIHQAPAIVDVAPDAAVVLRASAMADRPQAIVHTSGTTGAPKGAVLTWGNQAWSAAGSALRLGAAPEDQWLAVLPLFHVGGLAILLRAAWQGAAVVVHARFDAAAVWRALREDEISMISLVPTMLARLVDGAEGSGPPPSLRTALIGGGAAHQTVLDRAVAAGWPIALTYGLTEACSQVATTRPGWRPGDGLAAPPLPYTAVRIAGGGDGGDDGEILVRGPTVFAGYWEAPSATGRALDGEGWLRTGDLGRIDGRGRLSVVGRRGDLIVSGGENVYPAEVEAALAAHPTIAEACVLGIPDERWGERVVAMVVLRAGEVVGVAALEAFLRERLAGYKLPRAWQEVEALPRTASGKVRRAAARALWGDVASSSPTSPGRSEP